MIIIRLGEGRNILIELLLHVIDHVGLLFDTQRETEASVVLEALELLLSLQLTRNNIMPCHLSGKRDQ